MVIKFRKWFNENKNLLDSNSDDFYKKMNEKWWVSKFDKTYEYSNSWEIDFSNFTWEELENKIDLEIKNRVIFYNNLNSQEKQIINFLWKNIYIFKNIKNNWDEEIFWEIIKDFHKNYKWFKPNLDTLFQNYWYEKSILLLREYDDFINKIKKMLIYYINIKINPNFNFEKSLLDNLWFKPCWECWQ